MPYHGRFQLPLVERICNINYIELMILSIELCTSVQRWKVTNYI